MARPRKHEALDLAQPIDLTAGAIARLTCPEGRLQAFMRDSKSPGLRVRVTAGGAKSYVFEAKLNRKTIRQTIGDVRAWGIDDARRRANELRVLLDEGKDPRELDREKLALDLARRDAEARRSATVGDAWVAYVAERAEHWSPHHLDDHKKLAQSGGIARGNRKNVPTIAGPLSELMSIPLRDLNAAAVEAWAKRETPKRAARVRLALRLLKAFLRWAAAEEAYKDVADASAASGTKTREAVGKSKRKDDHIQRDQLGPWFDSVRGIQNQVIATYLQCLLLTGARREELAGLRWNDVNFQWRSIAMKDKIAEEGRMVPLTPYVAHLLGALPRANEWVFSSARYVQPIECNEGRWENVSASGRLAEPSIAHRRACAIAGLEGLTLHGLRRSFASLCEWIEVPGGISAQIQGHAPQGVREQNYIRRPLDLLRLHHEKIEAWILQQAGVKFDAQTAAAIGHPSPVE